jgi:uncharacterized membrane protein (DUF106 family)
MSPVGSLTIGFKKRQAMAIDSENMRLMKRILEADASISRKDLNETYNNHKKYRKLIKKAVRNDFDLDRLAEAQKKLYGHVEGKTSASFFPPIS